MEGILSAVLTSQKSFRSQDRRRPFVLLTWAQSLDGMVAAAPDTRTLISGPSSMAMTHALRGLHDAILVGIGTVLADDPQLTCRISADTRERLQNVLKSHGRDMPDDTALHPRAVVLDPSARTPPTAKFLNQPHCSQEQRRPILFASQHWDDRPGVSHLQEERCLVERTASSTSRMLDLSAVMARLFALGVTSVMVEGGASVISSFLDSGLCDFAVVTVSPSLFGKGLALSDKDDRKHSYELTRIRDPKWTQLSEDVVLVGTLS